MEEKKTVREFFKRFWPRFMHYAVLVLAYFHRFCFVPLFVICALVSKDKAVFCQTVSYGCFAYAGWTVLGYLLKFRHIFCSYQSLYRVKMTPEHVDWKEFGISKEEIFGLPFIFALLGLIMTISSWIFNM